MSIRLSEKHGVNPSVMKCFYCGDDMGVALLGRLPGDAEAPRSGVFDREPCERCRKAMEQGVFLIEVRDGESGDNPYRTGRVWCVKDEAIKRAITSPAILEEALKRRCVFLPEAAAKMLGLHEVPLEGGKEG